MAHILISAAHKSSGKTAFACGLAAALVRRGRAVQPFKKGPDYIDPMWHRHAAGRPSFNLDFNTQDGDEIRATFARAMAAADIGLIEGNKGLYDGLAVDGSDCNAALAKLLAAPVLLVLDAAGLTRGVAPLVVGYCAFDPDVTIAGIVLNNLASARQEAKMRAALERYTDVPVVGAVGRADDMLLVERHLGLVTPDDAGLPAERIDAMATRVEAEVDVDAVEAIAATAPAPEEPDTCQVVASSPRTDLRIAVARDAAFGFYYADDLDRMRALGAEPVFFDTFADGRLPKADALFIGGGFPETHMPALESNGALRAEIRAAIAAGLPTYAECGGMMYLSRAIHWHGQRHTMVGALPADARLNLEPQGRGLVRLAVTDEAPWSPAADGETHVAAHEFHHASLEAIDPACRYAYRVERGTGIGDARDGLVVENCLASFSHLRHARRSPWVDRFVAYVRAKRKIGRADAKRALAIAEG